MSSEPAIFGDYIIYVDESGDHSLVSIDPQYPVFVLAFCIIEKRAYYSELVPRFQEFKFKWFGHDIVVFHESDIRKRVNPFVFLGDPEKRDAFMNELSGILAAAPFKVVASTIHKRRLASKYVQPDNPYSLALLFCMERAANYLKAQGQSDRVTHIVCEARGAKEDKALELEFLRIVAGRHYLQDGALKDFQVKFAHKRTNSTGLQLADLIARPLGIRSLRPTEPNRAFDIIRTKLVEWKTFP